MDALIRKHLETTQQAHETTANRMKRLEAKVSGNGNVKDGIDHRLTVLETKSETRSRNVTLTLSILAIVTSLLVGLISYFGGM